MALVYRNDEPELEILCGAFMLGVSGALLLADSPEVLIVRTAERADCEGLRALVAMLGRKSAANQSGGGAIVRECPPLSSFCCFGPCLRIKYRRTA